MTPQVMEWKKYLWTCLSWRGLFCSDNGKSSQVIGSTGDAPQLPKAPDEGLFTSWERAKANDVSRSFSSNHPSASSAAFSEENLGNLKQSVFDYVSFMDMNINQASASSQKETFERLGTKIAQALELPSLKISSDIKLTLKIIHSEISSLLAKDVELKTKQTQYLHAVSEKIYLFQELEKAKSNLSEVSSEVMVEDSIMMSLAVEIKIFQAMMDDCKARLAAKKRNVSQEVERYESLVEHYTSLEVDEGAVTELSNAADEHRDEWERFREQMLSVWGRLQLDRFILHLKVEATIGQSCNLQPINEIIILFILTMERLCHMHCIVLSHEMRFLVF